MEENELDRDEVAGVSIIGRGRLLSVPFLFNFSYL